MPETIDHEIDLYLLEVFNTLFDHEVRKSRRYQHPVSLVHIAICAEPENAQTQYAAEMIAINALDVELRDSDIPCRDGHDFLILMPVTGEAGARNACERLERSLNIADQTREGVPYRVTAYIGLVSKTANATLSRDRLKHEAANAMKYARATRSQKTVVHSDIE